MRTPYKCPKCGLANAMGAGFCASCGTSLGTPARAVTPPRPPAAAAPRPAATAPKPAVAPAPRAAPPPAPPPAAPTPSIPLPPAAGPAAYGTVSMPGAGFTWLGFWSEIRQSVTLTVIAVCTSVFLLFSFLDLAGIMSQGQALSWFGLSYRGFAQRLLFFQLFTAPFVHVGLFHLVFNMLSLYWLGQMVEARMGKRRYIELSALCALASMLAFLAFSWRGFAVGCGYSGVVFGILTAAAIFQPDGIVNFYGFLPLKMKYAVLVLGEIELMLMLNSGAGQGGAHWAHLTGALVAWWYLRLGGWQRMNAAAASLPAGRGRFVR